MTKPDPVALAPDCRPSASRRPGSCRRAAAPPAHAIVERRVPGRALMGAHVEIGRPNDVVAAPFHLPLRKPGAGIVRAERLHLVEDDEIGIPEIGIGRIVLRDHDRVVEYPALDDRVGGLLFGLDLQRQEKFRVGHVAELHAGNAAHGRKNVQPVAICNDDERLPDDRIRLAGQSGDRRGGGLLRAGEDRFRRGVCLSADFCTVHVRSLWRLRRASRNKKTRSRQKRSCPYDCSDVCLRI